MTIIVNTPSAKASPATGAAGPATGAATGAGGGVSSDLFASLLGMQMSAVGAMLPGLGDGGDGKPADDKPASKTESTEIGGDVQAALAMPLVAALQASLQPQPTQTTPQTDVKALSQDLLAQQTTAVAIDPGALLQAKQVFNWQGEKQQKLPDPDQTVAQFLPLQQLQPQQNQPQQQQAAGVGMQQLTLPQTLNDPSWGKALGEQVLSMVNLKMDKAQIQLNPPQLGPIEVTLKMNGTDQAQVLFTAAVPATREALENNMHRLSSMMSANGIQLTDSQVSSGQSGQQQQAQQQRKGRQEQGLGETDGNDALTAIKAARGILSIFA
ncbi:flagellar hook-length control protein FliK [Chromobacterium vaccinii]|uniref:flagellar hook-length control protein FliK n=1 Tax=Chromobacterium vaccinii TaxID=1108595 RepID=UPI003C78CB70